MASFCVEKAEEIFWACNNGLSTRTEMVLGGVQVGVDDLFGKRQNLL